MLSSIARVIANISPIIIVVVFSKFTSVEQLGDLNYFIALITLLGVFSDFGIPEAIQTFLPKQKNKTVTPYLVMEFALVAITAVAVFIIDRISGGEFARNQLTLLVVITLASAANTVIIVYNGLLERTRMAIYYLGSAITLLAVTFGLFWGMHLDSVDSFLWGRLISWVIFLLVPMIDLYISGHLRWEFKLPLEQLRFTFNNFLVRAFYTLTFQWDTLLVSFSSGAYVTGYFRTVALAANMPLVLATFINTKLLPEFSLYAHERKFAKLDAIYRKYLLLIFGLAAGTVIVSIPLAHWGLSTLFSTEIADAGSSAFVLLFISAWLYVISIPALTLLQALTRDGFLVLASAVQAVVFVVLSTVLYPQLGLAVVPALLIGVNALFALTLIIGAHYLLSLANVGGSDNFTK